MGEFNTLVVWVYKERKTHGNFKATGLFIQEKAV
jgi:hypothetical protein